MKTNFKKSLLSVSIFAILSGATMVQAAETTSTDKENVAKKKESSIEVIEVVGTRGSLKRSMNAKRFSDQVMDGVSAEDIGKLPDNNIAEALSRVVGVSMSRADGEGEFVSIRGMAPGLSQVTLNGQSMANSNGSAISSNASSSRSFNLNNIASEMVGGIEVFKSPTASMVEGSVGGTINLKTRSPISSGDKAVVSVRADYNDNVSRNNYNDSKDAFGSGVNLFLNKVNDDETFGASVAVSYFDRTTQRNAFETRGWALQTAEINDKTKGASPFVNSYNEDGTLKRAGASDTDVYHLHDFRSNFRTDQRERLNVNTKIQWLISDELDFTADALYSRQKRNFISTNWDVNLSDSNNVLKNTLVTAIEDIYIDGENVVKQTSSPGAKTKLGNFTQSGFDRDYDDETLAVNLALDYFISDNWIITPKLGYSQATGLRSDINPIFGAQVDDLGYSLANGSYIVEAILPTDAAGITAMLPENSTLEKMNYKNWDVEDKQGYTQIDVSADLDNDYISSIEFGARYNIKEKSNITKTQKIESDIKIANDGKSLLLSDYSNYNVVDNMLDNAPVNGWYVPDFDKLDAAWGYLNDPEEIPEESYTITESVAAVYAQANISAEFFDIPVRGNVGVRYVDTRIESSSMRTYSKNKETGITPPATPTENKTDYQDVLPSINLAFNLSDELILRAAAAKVMARPNHADIAPVIKEQSAAYDDFGDATNSGKYKIGDPELKPYRANQYDLAVEWYFDSEGLLSAGIFYKDIDTFITTRTAVVESDTVIPPLGFDNTDITVERPINGTGGVVQGFEISFQQAFYMLPEPFDGLGVAANYTYNDSDTELVNNVTGELMSLPGLSKDTANFMVYYEKYGVSTRLAYNYRSSYFSKFSWSEEALYIDSYNQLDFQLGYEFTKNMSINFEAKNITGENVYEYVGNPSRAYAVRDNGRTYSLSFKYSL